MSFYIFLQHLDVLFGKKIDCHFMLLTVLCFRFILKKSQTDHLLRNQHLIFPCEFVKHSWACTFFFFFFLPKLLDLPSKFGNLVQVELLWPNRMVWYPSSTAATGSEACVCKCKQASLQSLAESKWNAVRPWAFALNNYAWPQGGRDNQKRCRGLPAMAQ